MEQAVASMFENEKNIGWLRSFKGRMGDLNDAGIVLAFDGETCRGKMRYIRSNETFDLKGIWDNGTFQLDEIDSAGNITGKLEGTVGGNIMQANWNNYDNTIGRKFLLAEVKKLDNIPAHCGDNKWIRFYVAENNGTTIELLLQKGANNLVWGIAYYLNRSFKVHGQIDSSNYLNLTLRKSSGNLLGNLFAADFIGSRNFTAVLDRDENNRQQLYFRLTGQFSMDCIEYAGYVTNYDIIYPKTTNAAFNDWIGTKASEWVSTCRLQSAKDETNRSPATRAVQSASGWCEVEYVSDGIISGFLSGRTPWKNGQQDIAFNFDLKKGVEIRQRDIFKDLLDPASFAQSVIKTAFRTHVLYDSDEGFRTWIDATDFPFFTIRKEGICFSTEFNQLYGRQSMTVPYSELKPYLKDNSPLKELTGR